VLGGMIPVEPHWLELMRGYGALDDVDAVAIHGFPGMWWSQAPDRERYSHWKGWEDEIDSIRSAAGGRPIWITETGLATWNLRRGIRDLHTEQARRLHEAAVAPAERVYWCSLIDLDPAREAIAGFHVDEHEYHLGLVQWDGRRKPAWNRFASLSRRSRRRRAEPALSQRR
jgi:CDP-paratose 2-epimerase